MRPALFLIGCFCFFPFTTSSSAKEYLDQSYGRHSRQVFDLWTPPGNAENRPSPLVIYIHGGGWQSGTKNDLRKSPSLVDFALRKGMAIASLEYRFLKHAPLQTIMREDIGGFVQFIRNKARAYAIDPDRIFAYGFSAGGSASLWLATHDDLADSSSSDPVKRESTRISGAGHLNGQLSYDFLVWYRFFGKEETDRFMGAQVFSRYHLKSIEDLYTSEGEQIRQDLDSYGNLSGDDAPLLIWNSLEDRSEPDYNHFVHSPNHARLLSKRANEARIKTLTLIRADGDELKDGSGTAFSFFEGLQRSLPLKKPARSLPNSESPGLD
jgi:acetyl esterase/lipase